MYIFISPTIQLYFLVADTHRINTHALYLQEWGLRRAGKRLWKLLQSSYHTKQYNNKCSDYCFPADADIKSLKSLWLCLGNMQRLAEVVFSLHHVVKFPVTDVWMFIIKWILQLRVYSFVIFLSRWTCFGGENIFPETSADGNVFELDLQPKTETLIKSHKKLSSHILQ